MDFHSTIYIIVFIVGFLSMGIAIVNFGGMITQVRPERRMLANFVAPLLPILPNMLTENGNRYRRRFLLFLVIWTACVAVIYGMEQSYGQPPYMEKLNEK